jgi:raffinose/stachyose/melibiose transport system permease protein
MNNSSLGTINKSSSILKDNILFYLPVLVIYGLFFIFPVLSAFYYSMTDWNGLAKEFNFIGLNNFIKLIKDDTAKQAMINTFKYTTIFTICVNIFGAAMALIFDKKMYSRNLAKSVFFLPNVFNALIIGYVWSYIYSPIGGIVNSFLELIGLENLSKAWLGDMKTVVPAIALAIVWQYTGAHAIMYLAGLQSIPEELYEASYIDGASQLQQFKNITFPLLAPAITINCVWSFIGGLKIFDVIYVMTNGGPADSSQSITTIVYNYAFTSNRFGYATSLGVVLFIIVSLLSTTMTSFLRRREVEL